ncbi:MAG: histidine phosphatase family protein [Thermoprotei archaeon]
MIGFMLIYCVRHGESESNVSHFFPDESNPPKLTERGREQAKRVAEHLKTVRVEAIFTSPVLRTMETAKIVSERLGVPYTVDPRLREIGLGLLAGREYSAVRSESPNWYHEYFDASSKYGVEKFMDVVERVSSAASEAYHKGYSSVVFVSHVEPIRALLATSVGNVGEWVRHVRISNASVTVISVNEGQSRLLAVNWLPLQEYVE